MFSSIRICSYRTCMLNILFRNKLCYYIHGISYLCCVRRDSNIHSVLSHIVTSVLCGVNGGEVHGLWQRRRRQLRDDRTLRSRRRAVADNKAHHRGVVWQLLDDWFAASGFCHVGGIGGLGTVVICAAGQRRCRTLTAQQRQSQRNRRIAVRVVGARGARCVAVRERDGGCPVGQLRRHGVRLAMLGRCGCDCGGRESGMRTDEKRSGFAWNAF